MQRLTQADRTSEKEGGERTVRNKSLKKFLQKDTLLIMILSGVLLFVIALPTKTGEEKGAVEPFRLFEKEADPTAYTQKEQVNGQTGEKDRKSALDDYKKEQEKQLAELLKKTEGTGDVKVMISFYSSEEQVLQKDENIVRSNVVGHDAAGNGSTTSQYEDKSITVRENDPYIIKTLSPRPEGVVVAAQGADNPAVSENIRKSVIALYGLGEDRVIVLPMER